MTAGQEDTANSSSTHTRAYPSDLYVDFNRVDVSALRRYQAYYNIRYPPNTKKDEMALNVAEHFARQIVDRNGIIQRFLKIRKEDPLDSSGLVLRKSARNREKLEKKKAVRKPDHNTPIKTVKRKKKKGGKSSRR
eukprot:GILJ01006535.1.p1 GENE.GILJ01006535.1~~GILJ01006535.1.p1  ORF type:complete len:150 (-),score=28.47 GILJ01006535.1:116-520(-)